jgi:hypothetical protein
MNLFVPAFSQLFVHLLERRKRTHLGAVWRVEVQDLGMTHMKICRDESAQCRKSGVSNVAKGECRELHPAPLGSMA